MPQFNVHISVSCRIKISNIEAEDWEDAMRKAEAQLDVKQAIDDGDIEDEEMTPLYYTIDPLDEKGEVMYDQTKYIGDTAQMLRILNKG